MKKLFKEHKPVLYFVGMLFWLILGVVGLFLKWSLLSLLMCLSLAASCFIFIGTSKKDAEWIAEHGDPDEYEKKMQALEAEEARIQEETAEADDNGPDDTENNEEFQGQEVAFVDEEGQVEEALDVPFEVEK